MGTGPSEPEAPVRKNTQAASPGRGWGELTPSSLWLVVCDLPLANQRSVPWNNDRSRWADGQSQVSKVQIWNFGVKHFKKRPFPIG